MFDLGLYLSQKKEVVDEALDAHLPKVSERPCRLHEAMRYSVFAGGKRLRPILAFAAAEAIGVDEKSVIMPAIAVEVLHTYTLVHDDLPSLDNDDLRRGQPSLHMAYDEATAILAGDALLTLAFEWMANCEPPKPYGPSRFALELARAAGSRGVIAGQIEDLAAEGNQVDQDRLIFIHSHKTATLIRTSVRIGAIAAAAHPTALDQLTIYGDNIGLAFQIADDILDETSDDTTLGKPVGSDRKQQKTTFASLLGLERSQQKARELVENAVSQLTGLCGNKTPLEAIARFVIDRIN